MEQDEESSSSKNIKLEEELDDMEILHTLQTNLLKDNDQFNDHVNRRLFETQKQYFTVYMQKLMDKVPMGKELVDIVRDMGGDSGFEYTFTAAKSIINSRMRVGQIKAFQAVFDMVYGLVGRYIHDKMVTPSLSNILSREHLQKAYEAYQEHSTADEDGSMLEFQCLLYCIQEMLEKQETVKIPNPLYTRLTQQMKGMSEYIITLLVSVAKPGPKEPPDYVFHQAEPSERDIK